MRYRSFFAGVFCIGLSLPAVAQISKDAKYDILRTVVADQAAARVALPFGHDGVELSESGEINQNKLAKDLKENGQSIETGKIVTITAIEFDDDRVEVELDNGGKNKKSIFERIQVGMGTGSRTVPVNNGSGTDTNEKAKGSKIIVRFARKVPGALTPDALKQLLSPVLDFNKRNFMKTGIDALPPEFQEAVRAKEARIGMDRNTVLMALDRPNQRVREKEDGVETEMWIYNQRGLRTLFVKFEDNVVISVRQER
jgi:hypothetical protein